MIKFADNVLTFPTDDSTFKDQPGPRRKFRAAVTLFERYLPDLKLVLPVLQQAALTCTVLSASDKPTLGLVLPQLRELIEKSNAQLELAKAEVTGGNARDAAVDILEAAVTSYTNYFFEWWDNPLLLAATLLDVTVAPAYFQKYPASFNVAWDALNTLWTTHKEMADGALATAAAAAPGQHVGGMAAFGA